MLPEDLDQICQLALLSGLTPETLLELAKGAFLQFFAADTLLFGQGDLPDFLYILVAGFVQLVGNTPQRRQSVIEILGPVEMFMPDAALTMSPYLVSARVLRPARILMLPAPAVRAQVIRDRRFAMAVSLALSRRYCALVGQAKSLKLLGATQRLARYLLTLKQQSGGAGRVRLPFEKRIIASLLGMTAESLSRSLTELRKLGVENAGDEVTLKDVPALEAYCRPDPLDATAQSEIPAN